MDQKRIPPLIRLEFETIKIINELEPITFGNKYQSFLTTDKSRIYEKFNNKR